MLLVSLLLGYSLEREKPLLSKSDELLVRKVGATLQDIYMYIFI